VDLASAIDDLHAQSRRAAAAFEGADVLLCPTLNVLPPPPGSLSASRGVPKVWRRSWKRSGRRFAVVRASL